MRTRTGNFAVKRWRVGALVALPLLSLATACTTQDIYQVTSLPDARPGQAIDAAVHHADAIDTTPDAAPSSLPDLSGSWQLTAGAFDDGANFGGTDFEFLSLDASGGGGMFTQPGDDDVDGCVGFTYAVLNANVVTFDIGTYGTHPHARGVHSSISGGVVRGTSGVSIGNADGETVVLQFNLVDANTLTLSDSNGVSSSFTRIDSLGPVVCAAMNIPQQVFAVDENEESQQPSSAAVVTDGTSVWFPTAAGTLQQFDPVTGDAGTSIANSQLPLTMQDGDFWLNVDQGTTATLVRMTQAGDIVDTLDLTTFSSDFQQDPYINGAATDGSTMWVIGTDLEAAGANAIYAIDMTSDPRSLISTTVLTDDFLASNECSITFANGELWMLGSNLTPALLEIDPTSGGVVQTYSIPDLGGVFEIADSSLAAFDNHFYMLVNDQDGNGNQFFYDFSIPASASR